MANTYTLISSVTVGAGGASSIDFTSIPATYTDLKLVLSLRSNRATVDQWVAISFNSNTSNYTWREIEGSGSGVASYNGTTERLAVLGASGNSSTASTFGNADIYIPNYAGSNNKSFSGDGAGENNATAAYMGLNAGLWSNTSAITSISLTPYLGTSWNQYSTAYLYGIKNS